MINLTRARPRKRRKVERSELTDENSEEEIEIDEMDRDKENVKRNSAKDRENESGVLQFLSLLGSLNKHSHLTHLNHFSIDDTDVAQIRTGPIAGSLEAALEPKLPLNAS